MREHKDMEKKKALKKKLILIYILLFAAIAAAIISAVAIGIEMFTTKQAQEYYSSLTGDVEKNPRPPVDLPPGTLPNTPNSPYSPGHTSPSNGGGSDDAFIWLPYVDFDVLNATFRGTTAAWILLEDTVIDYPVMQGSDNDYFLRRLPDGTNHRNGSIFIDYRCSSDFTDRNTLLYGHDMRSGDMFGAFRGYNNQAFYEQHPVFYIFTPERDYALVLFAAYKLDSAVEVPPLTFRDDEAFMAHVANIKQRSVFRSDVEVSVGDRIVSLATCDASHKNARLIVVGKLIDLGPFEERTDPPNAMPE